MNRSYPSVDTDVSTSETTLTQFVVYMREYPVPLQCPYSALTVPLQFPYGNYHSALIFYCLKRRRRWLPLFNYIKYKGTVGIPIGEL